MGKFSDQAIGFFLQVENQLSPTLKVADKDYQRFVGRMDKANTAAYASASKSLGQYAALSKSLTTLPKQAAKAFASLTAQLERKPIVLRKAVELVFTPGGKAEKSITGVIGRAVSKAFSSAKLRLSAAMPRSKTGLFDTAVGLRSHYKGLAQPPDMLGAFHNLPRFAEGGVVPNSGSPVPPPPGKDNVLAWLTPGETVLPVGWEKAMAAVTKSGEAAAPAFAEAGEGVFALAKALGKLGQQIEKGQASADQIEAYNEGIERLEDSIGKLTTAGNALSKKSLAKMAPFLKAATTETARFGDAVDDTRKQVEGLFEKTLKEERFQSLAMALRGIQGDAGQLGDVEGTRSFIDSLNDMNKTLDLSRDELHSMKIEAATLASDGKTDMQVFGRALTGLADAGVRGKDALLGLGQISTKYAMASGREIGSVAKDVAVLSQQYGQTDEQIALVLARQRALSAASKLTGDDLGQVFESTRANAESFLAVLDKGAAANVLTNLQGFAAGLSNVVGKDAVPAFTDMITRALGGDKDARQNLDNFLARSGTSFEAFSATLQQADGMQVMDDMVGRLGASLQATTANATTATQKTFMLSQVAGDLGLSGEAGAAALAQLANKGADAGKMMEAAVAPSMQLTDGMGELNAGVGRTTTFFGGLRMQISAFVTKHGGAELLDWIKEVNPAMLLSGVYLLGMAGNAAKAGISLVTSLVPALGSVFTKMTGIGKAAPMMAAGTGAAGAGAASFLTGVAKGLGALANPKVLIAMAAVTGVVIGLGFAANLAAPMMKELMGGVIGVVSIFKEMDSAQILSTAGALLAFGPAMLGIGAGAAALGAGLLLAVPGLWAFAELAPLLGGGAKDGAGILSSTINGLASAFQVDESEVMRAVKGVGLAAALIGGIAVAGVALAGLTAGSAVFSVGKFLFSWAVDSSTKALVKNAKGIASTVVTLAGALSPLTGETTLRQVEATASAVQSVATLASNYATISGSLTAAAPKTGKLVEFVEYFYADGEITTLAASGLQIRNTVESLLKTFGGMAQNPEELKNTTDMLGTLAEFSEKFGAISAALTAVAPADGVLPTAWRFWWSGDGIAKLADEGPKIKNTLNSLIGAFGGMNDASAVLPQVVSGGKAMDALSHMLWRMAEVGVNVGKVNDEWARLHVRVSSDGHAEGHLVEIFKNLGHVSLELKRYNPDVEMMNRWGVWVDGLSSVLSKLASIGNDTANLHKAAELGRFLADDKVAFRAIQEFAGASRVLTSDTGFAGAGAVTAAEVESIRSIIVDIVGEDSALHRQAIITNQILAAIHAKIGTNAPAPSPVLRLAPGVSRDTLFFAAGGSR